MQIDHRMSWGHIVTIVVLVLGFATQYTAYGTKSNQAFEIANMNENRIELVEREQAMIKRDIADLNRRIDYQTQILVAIAEKMGVEIHPFK